MAEREKERKILVSHKMPLLFSFFQERVHQLFIFYTLSYICLFIYFYIITGINCTKEKTKMNRRKRVKKNTEQYSLHH